MKKKKETQPQVPSIPRLIRDLQSSEDARRQSVPAAELDPQLALLRAWQSRRLERTYADLLADPRYEPACRFILSDIYAPRDFSQRDHDAEQIHAVLSRFLPAALLQTLTDAIEMNRLTAALDQALLRMLVDQLGMTGELTPELYAQGYRACDNYAERLHQIELITGILRQVGEGARFPGVGVTLAVARKPAERLGWAEAFDFLVRGRAAFKPMRDVETFVSTIQRRETCILDQIYAGAADPFNIVV